MKWNKQLQQALIVISVLSSVAFYWLFAYELKRSNFTLLTVLFSLSFLAYALIYKLKSNFKLSWFIAIAIFFRLLFLFSIPSLSDDFFRFLWDGQLLVNGINPYALLPTEVQLSFPNKELLLSQMNSPIYYSIYPPLNQLFFAIPALISPQSILGSVVVLRLIIISAEIGTLLILPKLLKQLALSPHKSLLYALNPLVIVELTGNLHFEALWVFALLGSIYLLQKKQLYLSSIFWAAAASIKLIPLLFLPALMRMLSSSKWMRYYVLTALVFGLGFFPFFDEQLVSHYSRSLKLYSSSFEFNASIYYVFRAIGFYFVDYNPIKSLGPIVTFIGLSGLVFLLLRKPINSTQSFFGRLLFGLSWYYLFALVVHPWYIAPLVLFSLFSRFRYVILWSYTITLSYYAYSQEAFLVNYWVLTLEYGLVFGLALLEFSRSEK